MHRPTFPPYPPPQSVSGPSVHRQQQQPYRQMHKPQQGQRSTPQQPKQQQKQQQKQVQKQAQQQQQQQQQKGQQQPKQKQPPSQPKPVPKQPSAPPPPPPPSVPASPAASKTPTPAQPPASVLAPAPLIIPTTISPALAPASIPLAGPSTVTPRPLPFAILARSRNVFEPAYWYGLAEIPAGLGDLDNFEPQPVPFPVIAISATLYHPAFWYGLCPPPDGEVRNFASGTNAAASVQPRSAGAVATPPAVVPTVTPTLVAAPAPAQLPTHSTAVAVIEMHPDRVSALSANQNGKRPAEGPAAEDLPAGKKAKHEPSPSPSLAGEQAALSKNQRKKRNKKANAEALAGAQARVKTQSQAQFQTAAGLMPASQPTPAPLTASSAPPPAPPAPAAASTSTVVTAFPHQAFTFTGFGNKNTGSALHTVPTWPTFTASRPQQGTPRPSAGLPYDDAPQAGPAPSRTLFAPTPAIPVEPSVETRPEPSAPSNMGSNSMTPTAKPSAADIKAAATRAAKERLLRLKLQEKWSTPIPSGKAANPKSEPASTPRPTAASQPRATDNVTAPETPAQVRTAVRALGPAADGVDSPTPNAVAHQQIDSADRSARSLFSARSKSAAVEAVRGDVTDTEGGSAEGPSTEAELRQLEADHNRAIRAYKASVANRPPPVASKSPDAEEEARVPSTFPSPQRRGAKAPVEPSSEDEMEMEIVMEDATDPVRPAFPRSSSINRAAADKAGQNSTGMQASVTAAGLPKELEAAVRSAETTRKSPTGGSKPSTATSKIPSGPRSELPPKTAQPAQTTSAADVPLPSAAAKHQGKTVPASKVDGGPASAPRGPSTARPAPVVAAGSQVNKVVPATNVKAAPASKVPPTSVSQPSAQPTPAVDQLVPRAVTKTATATTASRKPSQTVPVAPKSLLAPASKAPVTSSLPPKPVMAPPVSKSQPTTAVLPANSTKGPTQPAAKPLAARLAPLADQTPVETPRRDHSTLKPIQPHMSPVTEPRVYRPMQEKDARYRSYHQDDHYSPAMRKRSPPPRRYRRSPSPPPRSHQPRSSFRPRSPSFSPPPPPRSPSMSPPPAPRPALLQRMELAEGSASASASAEGPSRPTANLADRIGPTVPGRPQYALRSQGQAPGEPLARQQQSKPSLSMRMAEQPSQPRLLGRLNKG